MEKKNSYDDAIPLRHFQAPYLMQLLMLHCYFQCEPEMCTVVNSKNQLNCKLLSVLLKHLDPSKDICTVP